MVSRQLSGHLYFSGWKLNANGPHLGIFSDIFAEIKKNVYLCIWKSTLWIYVKQMKYK